MSLDQETERLPELPEGSEVEAVMWSWKGWQDSHRKHGGLYFKSNGTLTQPTLYPSDAGAESSMVVMGTEPVLNPYSDESGVRKSNYSKTSPEFRAYRSSK